MAGSRARVVEVGLRGSGESQARVDVGGVDTEPQTGPRVAGVAPHVSVLVTPPRVQAPAAAAGRATAAVEARPAQGGEARAKAP